MSEETGIQGQVIVPKKRTSWDELDFYILREIFEKEFVGTRIITKSFFFKQSEFKGKITWRDVDKREVDKKELVVLYRLKRLARLGIILINKTNIRGRIENEYLLASEKVKINRRRFPDCKGKEILLKVNGKWEGFQL